MSRKKNCRRPPAEQAIHEEAVRLRKMTDKQLVEQFHRAADSSMAPRGPQAPQEPSKKSGQENTRSSLEKLLSALSEGKCKGIKGATVYKLTEFASEMGLL